MSAHASTYSYPLPLRWPAVNDAGIYTIDRLIETNSTLTPAPAQTIQVSSPSKLRDDILASAELMKSIAPRARRTRQPARPSESNKPTISRVKIHEDGPTAPASNVNQPNPAQIKVQMVDEHAQDCLSPAQATKLNTKHSLPSRPQRKRKPELENDVENRPKRARLVDDTEKTTAEAFAGVARGRDAQDSNNAHTPSKEPLDRFDEDDTVFEALLKGEAEMDPLVPSKPKPASQNAVESSGCLSATPSGSIPSPFSRHSTDSSQSSPGTSMYETPIKPFIHDTLSIVRAAGIRKIPGLSTQQEVLTCFRIAEVRRLHNMTAESVLVVEIFAHIKRCYMVGQAETLNVCFADLFFPTKPPFLESVSRDQRTVRNATDLIQNGKEKQQPVKAMLKVSQEAIASQSNRHQMGVEVLSISTSTWDEVGQANEVLELTLLEASMKDL